MYLHIMVFTHVQLMFYYKNVNEYMYMLNIKLNPTFF